MRKLALMLGATLLCAAVFCGCGQEEAPMELPAEIEVAPTEKPAAQEGKYKDGVYTAGRRGYAGDVVVTATIADDTIVDIQIEGLEETKGVGSVAIERMRERLLTAQFGDVDVVSGATVTSEAVKAALADILAKAAY
ncbi:MAG: FMN-binding protein [Eubacteriales bacterium]|nr:FMN-binding protein [Eubacteriales bacterium]